MAKTHKQKAIDQIEVLTELRDIIRKKRDLMEHQLQYYIDERYFTKSMDTDEKILVLKRMLIMSFDEWILITSKIQSLNQSIRKERD